MDREEILRAKDESLAHLKSVYGDDAETILAERRYGFISGLLQETLKKPSVEKLTLSDKIDRVLLNRWLGIPIFLAFMFGVFQFVFVLSAPLMDWINAGFGWLGGQALAIGGWGGSLLGDGIIAGVGAVLTFIPPIFLLFIALAVLEDSGYMARAAFLMDRVMHKVGLHGRSMISMLLGFGCSVPAIMATRTIENPRDRLTTILVTPLMSCGARLPIYILFAGAFFTAHQGLVVFSFYFIGIMLAVVMAFVFRKWLLPGPSGHFVMELPSYRLPTVKAVIIHMWERGKWFLIRAGTIIFAGVVLIWVLNYTGALEPIGRAIAPIFSPAGFGQWQAAVALVSGFLAKEAVIGSFGTLFGVEQGALGTTVGSQLGWTPLIAYAFMAFCLIYVPCVATIAIIKKETASWKWPLFAMGYTTVMAWIAATLIYQIGRLFTG